MYNVPLNGDKGFVAHRDKSTSNMIVQKRKLLAKMLPRRFYSNSRVFPQSVTNTKTRAPRGTLGGPPYRISSGCPGGRLNASQGPPQGPPVMSWRPPGQLPEVSPGASRGKPGAPLGTSRAAPEAFFKGIEK